MLGTVYNCVCHMTSSTISLVTPASLQTPLCCDLTVAMMPLGDRSFSALLWDHCQLCGQCMAEQSIISVWLFLFFSMRSIGWLLPSHRGQEMSRPRLEGGLGAWFKKWLPCMPCLSKAGSVLLSRELLLGNSLSKLMFLFTISIASVGLIVLSFS